MHKPLNPSLISWWKQVLDKKIENESRSGGEKKSLSTKIWYFDGTLVLWYFLWAQQNRRKAKQRLGRGSYKIVHGTLVL